VDLSKRDHVEVGSEKLSMQIEEGDSEEQEQREQFGQSQSD
jgi:hypothetical protein